MEINNIISIVISIIAGFGSAWMTLNVKLAVYNERIKTLFSELKETKVDLDVIRIKKDQEYKEIHTILDLIKQDVSFIKGKIGNNN